MADDDVKARMEETKARTEEIRKAGTERLTKGKPTPTQEENDRAASGEHVLEKEDDGSGPDPGVVATTRTLESSKPGSYQTRQAAPKPTPPKPASSS